MDKNYQSKKSLPTYTAPKDIMDSLQLEENNEVVEDLNKKLDNIEKSVYKKRTRIVTTIEGMLFVISLFLKLNILINVLTYSFITMALILSFGKYKNTYLTKKITND